MGDDLLVDVDQLRNEVGKKYEEVAVEPDAEYHFLTGRPAAERHGYPLDAVDALPTEAVGPFAGVACPFHWGMPRDGERVVDIGSGAGMDSLLAARAVGPSGAVVGVDMTPAMLERARRAAEGAGLDNVEFREGLAEELPVPDGWADLVISNGVLNLVPDKTAAYREVARVLRPGGRIQIADICVEKPVPEEAKRDIDLWTG